MLVGDLKKVIREIPDFPKPGINFYDITTLFADPVAFKTAVNKMVERYRGEKIDAFVGIEARGFILASIMAHTLDTSLVLIRKPGKLPGKTLSESYDLEYGTNQVEIHEDALEPGNRVVIVDDLLATGGTAAAAGKLLNRLDTRVEGFAFLVELAFLNGREALGDRNVFSLIIYE
jgi:adenine phosphoribosyltransferase